MASLRGWVLLLLAGGAWAHGHRMDIHLGGSGTVGVPLAEVRRLVFSGLAGSDSLAAPVATLALPSGGQALLSWTAVPEALEYRVYGVDPSTGAETLLQSTSGTSVLLDVPASAVRVLRVRAAR
jgi:hypothetical protein